MSNPTLSTVWSQIELMLADGLSVIPVRDKQEGDKPPKTAYYKWKDYQSKQYTKDALWHDMEAKGTLAVSIVCGTISGNLEVVDIDTKFKNDAAIILFEKIKNFDAGLFKKLRIHKTPSGGFHLLYRVSDAPTGIPGNVKLAGRVATEEELLEKPKIKIYNFLETRGEGGYVLAPPSMGYSFHTPSAKPIPIITWQDRNNIIALCKTMDEEIKYVPQFKLTAKTESYYEDSPWDDYNQRADPADILLRNGWIVENTSNKNNIYFTRPGKTSGISMSFREDIRKFYCFTSSTEFELNTAYSCTDVILILEHNNDKKSCYCYLVNNGYGKVKPRVEQSVAVNLARKGKALPHNFSEAAIELHTATIEQLKLDHPYGVYIKYDNEEDKLQVSRESLLYVANSLGFRWYDDECVRIEGNLIYPISERQFQDVLKEYITEEDAEEYEKLCNTFESFMQKNGKYTMTRLELLDSSLIIHDDKNTCFKFYKNGFLTITADEITFDEYNDFDLLIWAKSIQPRNYIFGSDGMYIDFIKQAVVNQEQAMRILGYLSHEYKDETTGYIIVLTETCPDPKFGGGSGKNVFCNLLKLTTSYTSKPGSQTKFDEKFFQSWNRQRIFGISDVDKNFDFMFLKEPSTGSFIWKKLFKDEVEVPVEDAPKFIVQSNYSFEISDGGLRRRIIPLEFTDFFTKSGGLDVYYKKHFPNEWSTEDYAGFDNYIATSVQEWLKCGRKLTATPLSEGGWQKQWEQAYGQTAVGFILQHFTQWLHDGIISNESFKTQFDCYLIENNIPKHYSPAISKVNVGIGEYAAKHGVQYEKDVPIRSKDNVIKCRRFTRLPDTAQAF